MSLDLVSPLRPPVVTTAVAAAKKQRVVVSVLNKNLSEESIGDMGGLVKADDKTTTTAMAWPTGAQDDAIATWADMLKVGAIDVCRTSQ